MQAGEAPRQGLLVSRLAAETTFEGVGREWFEREKGTWVASHADRVLRRLEKDVFPWLGTRPIGDIAPQDKIQERGALETAHRAKWACSQIFKYGIETGRRCARQSRAAMRPSRTPRASVSYCVPSMPTRAGPLCAPLFVLRRLSS